MARTRTRKPRPSSVRKRRPQNEKRQRLITMLIIAGVVLVIMAGIVIAQSSATSASATPASQAGPVVMPPPREHPHAQDNAMGDPNAPVTIIEYSDFQCPYCRKFALEIEPQLIANEIAQGKVRFIYRTMGDFIGPESLDAAEAAYCAGEQNHFWDYHDILFANWRGENVGSFTPDRLIQFAQALGLDMNAFRSCFQSHKYRERALQDKKDGLDAGVRGTPSFVIIAPDGSKQLMEGAYPYEQFHKAIAEALQKQP